jgi:hypothetical protein
MRALSRRVAFSASLLLAVAAAQAAPAPLTFMALGDWGGGPLWWENYTTPEQRLCAAGMGAFAASAAQPAFTLALGDNFYALGLCNNRTLAPYNDTCPNATDPRAGTAEDVRFELTYESVYAAPALRALPFYVVAGNHDALGNVSASIAYTKPGGVGWQHPDFYYRVDAMTNAGGAAAPNETLSVLMVDTTLCYGIWSDPVHDAMCAAQLAWLERELAASRSAYLFVAGHYPVWSACAHGNTDWAIATLLPLLVAYNATGYLSGHDHCAELIAPADAASGGARDLVFVVSGTGDGCCYNESNILGVPPGASLKFLVSAGFNESSPSGFASFAVGPRSAGAAGSSLRVAFRSADASLIYESQEVLPRTPLAGAAQGMAAPDYAAAGLPRPSAAKPFRNYPQPVPPQQQPALAGDAGEEAAEHEDKIEEEPELLLLEPRAAAPVAAGGAGGATLGELVIWLYSPTALSADVWSGWYSELAAHRVNVTGVAPCSYFVSGDGSFTSQMSNASTAALAFEWTRRFASELGLATNPLIAASGTGMNALIRTGNEANASAFIAQTVAELVALNGSGFNVQLEEPGSPEIEAEWKIFLGKWADALAAAGNKTIALILGSICRDRDWMYMDCGDYKLLQQNHSNIRGITEATYTKEPSAWIDYAENIVRGLGNPVAQLGLEFGPPLLNHDNGALPKARELGVTTLFVWVWTNAPGMTDAMWASFGWWVNGV